MKNKMRIFLFLLLLAQVPFAGNAQQRILVNLALLDGLDITPDNILRFQIQSFMPQPEQATVRGTIRYRNSDMRISYQFKFTIQPGINLISAQVVSPRFTYSSQALKELFEQYKKLPEGIYEYCVEAEPDQHTNEVDRDLFSECIYHKSTDVFLINLIDPEDDAKIYEYNPALSWTANFPFAAALSYRLRIAAIGKGQNAPNAIARNNPVFDERNLMQMSLVYPVYAKPLQKNQPYAWTVSAFYKGILLGSAETWRFTIIEDSLLRGIPRDPSYVDIQRETGKYNLYAPGILKLKYDLKELKTDSLSLQLLDKKQKEIKLKEPVLRAVYGDNRFVLNFKEEQPLKHLQAYTLVITSQTGSVYRILFKYVNPEFLK